MSEPLYDITYTTRYTRSEIEEYARSGGDADPYLVAACREWVEANARGMTREEFETLPDTTIVAIDTNEYVKVGTHIAVTVDTVVGLRPPTDDDLAVMSITSMPPPPPDDEIKVVRDGGGILWDRDPTPVGGWVGMSGREAASLDDLRKYRGPLRVLVEIAEVDRG